MGKITVQSEKTYDSVELALSVDSRLSYRLLCVRPVVPFGVEVIEFFSFFILLTFNFGGFFPAQVIAVLVKI